MKTDDIVQGGRVFRAHRDIDGVIETVVLKQLGALDDDYELHVRRNVLRLAPLADRHLAPLIEAFRGPGLFRISVPDEQDSDLLYVTYRWVEGPTLWSCGEHVVRNWERILADLVDAVEAVHRAGLIHGDIHPANIVLTDDGAVLIDLEEALEATGGEGTRPTGIAGFVPPEFETGGAPTQASDRWQLGMVATRLLVGHPLGRLSGTSLESELTSVHGRRRGKRLAALIGPMIDEDPDRRPSDLRAWAAELHEAWTGPRRWVAVAVASVAVAVTAIAFIVTRGDDGRLTAATADDVPVNSTPASAPNANGTTSWCERPTPPTSGLDQPLRTRLEAIDRDLGSLIDVGSCAGEPFAFSSALVIPVSTSDEPDGVVIAGPETSPLLLEERQWLSYRDIAGRERPENAVDLGGYPVSISTSEVGGAVYIELSSGGVMIAVNEKEQSFWIPQQLRGLWDESGGIDGDLGFPASNPFFFESHIVQDFELAEIRTTPDAIYRTADEIDFEVLRPEDRSAPLDAVGDLAGRILRQRSGVAWYVDERLVRHWIPDGDTFFCVGGEEALVPFDLPGYAVWSLEPGEPANCPS